jgi:hypothetical protein
MPLPTITTVAESFIISPSNRLAAQSAKHSAKEGRAVLGVQVLLDLSDIYEVSIWQPDPRATHNPTSRQLLHDHDRDRVVLQCHVHADETWTINV